MSYSPFNFEKDYEGDDLANDIEFASDVILNRDEEYQEYEMNKHESIIQELVLKTQFDDFNW